MLQFVRGGVVIAVSTPDGITPITPDPAAHEIASWGTDGAPTMKSMVDDDGVVDYPSRRPFDDDGFWTATVAAAARMGVDVTGIAPEEAWRLLAAPRPQIPTFDFADAAAAHVEEDGGMEIPWWMADSLGLEKGAGHRYVRRVPKPGGGYRYFYNVAGVHEEKHFEVGAKFQVHGKASSAQIDGGKGHIEIVGKTEGGNLKIRHDESGFVAIVSPTVLSAMLQHEHAAALDAHKAKLGADIQTAEKHGTPKQVAKLKAEAAKHEHTADLVAPKPAAQTLGPGQAWAQGSEMTAKQGFSFTSAGGKKVSVKPGDVFWVTSPGYKQQQGVIGLARKGENQVDAIMFSSTDVANLFHAHGPAVTLGTAPAAAPAPAGPPAPAPTPAPAESGLSATSLLDFMKKSPTPMTAAKLKYAFGGSPQSHTKLLQGMVAAGDLAYEGGEYHLAPKHGFKPPPAGADYNALQDWGDAAPAGTVVKFTLPAGLKSAGPRTATKDGSGPTGLWVFDKAVVGLKSIHSGKLSSYLEDGTGITAMHPTLTKGGRPGAALASYQKELEAAADAHSKTPSDDTAARLEVAHAAHAAATKASVKNAQNAGKTVQEASAASAADGDQDGAPGAAADQADQAPAPKKTPKLDADPLTPGVSASGHEPDFPERGAVRPATDSGARRDDTEKLRHQAEDLAHKMAGVIHQVGPETIPLYNALKGQLRQAHSDPHPDHIKALVGQVKAFLLFLTAFTRAKVAPERGTKKSLADYLAQAAPRRGLAASNVDDQPLAKSASILRDPLDGPALAAIDELDQEAATAFAVAVVEELRKSRSRPAVTLEPPPFPNREGGKPIVGVIRLPGGVVVDVECERGAVRRGVDAEGNEWARTMPDHYGEIRGTRGTDGDPLDIFVGDAVDAPYVYVVAFQDENGAHDEDKIFYNYKTRSDVDAAFAAAYSGRKDLKMAVRKLTQAEFLRHVHDVDAHEQRIESGRELAKSARALAAELYPEGTNRQPGLIASLRGAVELQKGGPFIGPKGGKWADSAHTIPWSEPHSGASVPPGKSPGEVIERAMDRAPMQHDKHWATREVHMHVNGREFKVTHSAPLSREAKEKGDQHRFNVQEWHRDPTGDAGGFAAWDDHDFSSMRAAAEHINTKKPVVTPHPTFKGNVGDADHVQEHIAQHGGSTQKSMSNDVAGFAKHLRLTTEGDAQRQFFRLMDGLDERGRPRG